MGVSKELISKFLIGNRFHVKLRILSPYSNRIKVSLFQLSLQKHSSGKIWLLKFRNLPEHIAIKLLCLFSVAPFDLVFFPDAFELQAAQLIDLELDVFQNSQILHRQHCIQHSSTLKLPNSVNTE